MAFASLYARAKPWLCVGVWATCALLTLLLCVGVCGSQRASKPAPLRVTFAHNAAYAGI